MESFAKIKDSPVKAHLPFASLSSSYSFQFNFFSPQVRVCWGCIAVPGLFVESWHYPPVLTHLLLLLSRGEACARMRKEQLFMTPDSIKDQQIHHAGETVSLHRNPFFWIERRLSRVLRIIRNAPSLAHSGAPVHRGHRADWTGLDAKSPLERSPIP